MFSRFSKGLVLALSLSAASFAVGCASPADENVGSDEGAATAAAALHHDYEGTIGNLKVLVRLEAQGSNVTGSYFYADKTAGTDRLVLKGTASGTKLSLTESVNGKGATTGTFDGTIGANGITGTWKAGATTLPLNLAPITSLKIATRKFQATAPLPAGEEEWYKCDVSGEAIEIYGLAPAAEKAIMTQLSQAIEPLDVDDKGTCTSDKRAHVQKVTFNKDGFLTIHEWTEYNGGAHPSYSSLYANFTTADGKLLDGAAIFKAGSENAVKEAFVKAIRATEGPDWSAEDIKSQIEELDNHWDAETKLEHLNVGIGEKGITIDMGNSYPHVILALAPVAEIPWSDVKPLLAPNSPVAPIAK